MFGTHAHYKASSCHMLLIMTTIIYCVIYLVNDTGCQPSYFLYCCHSHIISSAIVKAPDLYRDKIFRVADLKSLSFFSFPSYLDEISLFLFSWSFEFRDFFFPSGWGCWCLAQTPSWRTRSPNLKPQETLVPILVASYDMHGLHWEHSLTSVTTRGNG